MIHWYTVFTHIHTHCITDISVPLYTLYAPHISYFGMIDYRRAILHIFCHIINATEVMVVRGLNLGYQYHYRCYIGI